MIAEYYTVRVVITGAAGQIGIQVAEELSESHELILIDRVSVPGKESIVADLAASYSARTWWSFRRKSWSSLFEGVDAIVHLAADSRKDAPWECVLRDNIQVSWNVIEAAAKHRVPRFVFASSNWAVKSLELSLAPACYQLDGPKIGSADSPQPLRPYGMSKALGELAGQMFVDQRRLRSFIAVRIGTYGDAPENSDERLSAIWIGVQDLRSLLRRCVESLAEGFHIVYGVSGQANAPYDLSYTRKFLSWQPRQNALNGRSL